MRITTGINPDGTPHSRPNYHVFDRVRVTDRARVTDLAQVSGSAHLQDDSHVGDCARVSDKAQLFDQSRVLGHAQVSGDVNLLGSTLVCDEAQVSGLVNLNSVHVKGHARIEGAYSTDIRDFMRIGGSTVAGYAVVTGRPRINDGNAIAGYARIGDFATLYDQVCVQDQAQVSGNAKVCNCILKGTVHVTGTAIILGGTWTEGTISEGMWDAPGVHHVKWGPCPNPF